MTRRVLALFIIIVAAIVLSSMTSVISAQEFGTNWTAYVYDNSDVEGSAVASFTGVPSINFNWGSGRPVINGDTVDEVSTEGFSVRFVGVQNFQQGTYQFTATADDGVRIIIDGQTVFDRFEGSQQTITNTFTVNMTAGSHTITVEYFDGVGNALIQVQWGLVGGGTAVLTATFGPTPTPGPTNTPAPTSLPPIPQGAMTATVIRASVLNVRAAPSVYADRVGRIRRGQTYQIIGRDDRARWFLLQLSDRQAWAFGYYLFINGNEFNVPVVSTFVLMDNPASISGVVARAFAGLKLRAEPTVNSAQIGRIGWGDVMAVVGRTRSGEWLQVVFRGTTGWVYEPYTRIVEGEINSVPIVG
jgi:uncharacterized protein YraI